MESGNGEELLLICYASSAVAKFDKAELMALLDQARKRNSEVSVTGLLLYSDGNFLQVLEGPAESVETLFRRISQDPRHRGVLRLIKRATNERYFGDWSMACRAMSPEEQSQMGAYAGMLGDDADNDYIALLPDWIKRLSREFRRVNR